MRRKPDCFAFNEMSNNIKDGGYKSKGEGIHVSSSFAVTPAVPLDSERCTGNGELNSAQEELHVGPQLSEQVFAVFFSSLGR